MISDFIGEWINFLNMQKKVPVFCRDLLVGLFKKINIKTSSELVNLREND